MNLKEQIKHTGATFTPKELAAFLAERLTRHIHTSALIKVLDPACGDGELLLAMKKALHPTGQHYSLTGYDSNEDYLNEARSRLSDNEMGKVHFHHADFLEAVDLSHEQLALGLEAESKGNIINASADIIIANPPYVRTQLLGSEKAQKLAKKFNLKGRVDLYYPFLIAMTKSLKEGGTLGVITSNRYLSTKGGESIRKFLVDHFEIIELIDLGDTKLFDAAVLPAIFIGKKKKKLDTNSCKTTFLKIYEALNGYQGKLESATSIYDILKHKSPGYFQVGQRKYKKTNGILKYDNQPEKPWQMLSDNETDWVRNIEQNAASKVGDLFKVRVGIKTTADKVFIRDKWDELGKDTPEEEVLKDLITQENIARWGLTDTVRLRVLYTHVHQDGKKATIDLEKYPKAKKYLLSHEAQLKGRNYVIKAKREWFEIWVPQNPGLWKKPKLVFPDISVSPRFYFDHDGKIVNGNCYWMVANSKDDIDKLRLIQGIANSKLMTRYHDLVFNNKLYSGRRRYFSQYVEQYPLPAFSSKEAQDIIRIADELHQASGQSTIEKLETELEGAVAKAYGVSPVFHPD
ncbi:N-6 DNA methylase [Rapidithrix thailandica]|uniref:site-specific DNA-methyltransferase (adenine-specific) n=1 Tax=Rapidithrix thailandica TaxID=413964 RepID=A0AAW9S045_9BACT